MFLRERLTHSPGLAFVSAHAGRIHSYAMGLPGHGVVCVGPWLVAPEDPAPLTWLGAMSQAADGAPLRIGTLATNALAVAVLRGHAGLQEGEPSWRMVYGTPMGLGESPRLFAIGSAAQG